MLFFNRKKIRITVTPYGIVAKYVRGGVYELNEGAKLNKILRKTGASGLGINLVYMRGGERIKPSESLRDGDEIKILHLIGGG